jgi:hypothetical protein
MENSFVLIVLLFAALVAGTEGVLAHPPTAALLN